MKNKIKLLLEFDNSLKFFRKYTNFKIYIIVLKINHEKQTITGI